MDKRNTKKLLQNKPYSFVKWSFNDNVIRDKTERQVISLKDIKSQENYLKKQQTKSHNFFEYLYDDKYCKLFFDIDNISVDTKDLKQLIIDFHNKLCEYLECELDIKNLLCYVKKENLTNNDIHSIHILYKNHKITYQNNKNVCLLLEQSKYNVLTNGLDTGIYNKNRQYCLPYNSKPYSEKVLKLGYETPHKSNDRIFIDFNIHNENTDKIQTKIIRNYLVGYINEDYTEITLKENCIIVGDLDTQTDNNIDLDRYSETHSNREKFLISKNNKEEIIDILLGELNDSFFEPKYAHDWKVVIRNLKKMNICETEITEFLKHSCLMCDKYTLDKNIEYYKNINLDNMYINEYEMICLMLNKHNDKYYFYNDFLKCNKEDIVDFIQEKTNINCKEMLDTIDFNDCDITKIDISKECVFDMDTGFLTFNDKCYNYHIERDYTKHYQSPLETEIENNEVISVESEMDSEVQESIEMFIRGEIDLLSVCAKWGTGKSWKVVKPIIESMIKKQVEKRKEQLDFYKEEDLNDRLDYKIDRDTTLQLRIVCLTESNSLNSQVFSDYLSIENNNFYNHLQLQEVREELDSFCDWSDTKRSIENITEECSMITSLESCDKCVKLCGENWNTKEEYKCNIDCLILDEFESIINHFESNTFNKQKDGKNITAYTQYEHFIQMIKQSKQIIILDADITEERMKWICGILDKK